MDAKNKLKDISVENIQPNPENPRIVFRAEEMDQLLISIKKYGVQVPITVYEDGGKYILIDGERRWRTSWKLNLKTIPAIIQSRPSDLDNLLMMFNIHSLREQWDLFTIANKLTTVIDLLYNEFGHAPNEIEISEETGLNRSTIRRCKLLIELPSRFKDIILKELEKSKAKQKLTEDFFIEMESSLKTVRNNLPESINDLDIVRDNLIRKYQNGIIKNVVDFRYIAKLATSPKNVNYEVEKTKIALKDIFDDNNVGIEQIYNSTVGALYDERKLLSSFSNIKYYINHLTEIDKQDEEIRRSLLELKEAIDEVLRGA